jgi:hypothetical protein
VAVLALALVLPLAGPVRAHVALDPGRAQEILADVATHHGAAQSGSGAEATDALFTLGRSVQELVELMNQDLQAHGEINLFAQALVRRLEAYSVRVTLSPRTRTYAYDLAAFEQYLRRAPAGRHAADARFRLIAHAFYGSIGPDPSRLAGSDAAGLLRAIATEERFLREHPAHEKAREVRFFLAVDYYRAAWNLTDTAEAQAYEARARHELTRVVAGAPGSTEARAAATLLESLPSR